MLDFHLLETLIAFPAVTTSPEIPLSCASQVSALTAPAIAGLHFNAELGAGLCELALPTPLLPWPHTRPALGTCCSVTQAERQGSRGLSSPICH